MPFKTLYISREIAHTRAVRDFQDRLGVPARIVGNAAEVYQILDREPDAIFAGKQVLFLTQNRGAFIKSCPGTRHYTCCGYQILHIGSYCHMDCAYCILQAYFHPPMMQYFVNHEALWTELEAFFNKGEISRIGTGEFTDSLIWEPWTNLNTELVTRFARQERAVLELKTKTVNVSSLLPLAHQRKTILAWSLNTRRVIKNEERRTASLDARLKTAAACVRAGYPVAFHFDPLILYTGCEADYKAVIEQLFDRIAEEHIVWISLGALRFMPALKPVIQDRFPDSRMIYGELIPGLDGKLRYFKPLRIALFNKILTYIRKRAKTVMVYFCMEDDEVWRKTFGFVPADKGGLPAMLDAAAAEKCGLRL